MCKPDSFKIVATLARVSLALVALGPTQSASLAQAAKGGQVTVSEVSARSSANGTMVSIAADGSLSRAQTWQDREGYHVVVPSGTAPKQLKVGNGIKVTQLDHTLEILVQTKAGASVTAQPGSNHLNLAIEGKLDPRPVGGDTNNAPNSSATDASQPADDAAKAKSIKASEFVEPKAGASSVSGGTAGPNYIAQGPAAGSTSPANQAGLSSSDKPNAAAVPEEESSGLFSVTTLFLILVVGLLALVFIRWRQSKSKTTASFGTGDERDAELDEIVAGDKVEVDGGLIKVNGSNGSSGQRKSTVRMPIGMPPSLYGAFQVDQEVAKLVMGQPHKMEVLASRAPDDRRAIEASLLKALASTDEDEQRRVREALEEYGFVARLNAAVLLSSDPYDRTSAARMLGDIESSSALPFLLEALYDNESIVRNQAVLSIGELRLPSAIGALLDIARKHTDVPGALLSRALSACSVDGLDFFDSPIPEPRVLNGTDIAAAYEMKRLKPTSAVQELPESVDDRKFVEALAKLEAPEIVERAEGIKLLAQFAVRDAVTALALVARRDAQSNLRALAIASLATINHESVFPSVLIGMADESREVRAAAARALSRLSFDRADAYTRVMETDDLETLRDVAQACVRAGVASQALDRLASSDRRQANESLSLVSLLAKAEVFEPIVIAIENHPNLDVRMGAVRLLGAIGQPAVVDELKQIDTELIPVPVRVALAETIAELEAASNAGGSMTQAVTEQTESEHADSQDEVHHSDEGAEEQHELSGIEPELEQNELDDFDCQCAPEQPLADTSGLPAPPIA